MAVLIRKEKDICPKVNNEEATTCDRLVAHPAGAQSSPLVKYHTALDMRQIFLPGLAYSNLQFSPTPE